MKRYHELVSRTKVAPELLVEAVVEARRKKAKGVEEHVVCIIDMLSKRGLPEAKLSKTAMAVHSRLIALARLVRDGELSGWEYRNKITGASSTHYAVFKAAASQPLVELDAYQWVFEPQRFRDAVLKLSDVEGSA